eukprot:SAG31_NODE_33773_length_340_cov_0.755187_1_plen_91_part_10
MHEQPALEAAKFASAALKLIRRFAGPNADFGSAAAGSKTEVAKSERQSVVRQMFSLGWGATNTAEASTPIDPELTVSLFGSAERESTAGSE